MNDAIWTWGLMAAIIPGISLPQVIASEYKVVPSFREDNSIQTEILPTPKLRRAPQLITSDPAPTITARAGLVIDKTSGFILWQKNADSAVPIASITKLITVLVAQDSITNWDEPYTLQWSEVSRGGATFSGVVGDTFTKSDLLKTALVASANSAALALAHSTGLTDEQFVEAMNTKAQLLGMRSTRFVEPTGLNAGNVSTVIDLAMLMRTITVYPRLLEPLTEDEHRMMKRDGSGQPLPGNQEVITTTTNRLLKENDQLIVAGKTGFTDEAGYNLVTLARDNEGHKLIVVLLGGVDETSRFTETHTLAQWTFDNYTW